MGMGRSSEKDMIFWLVGYVEKNGKVYYYALNFVSDDYQGTINARFEILDNILKDLILNE